MADAMVKAEARFSTQRKLEEQDCDCKDGMFPSRVAASRRTFILAAGSAAGVATAAVGFKFMLNSKLLIINPLQALESEAPDSIIRREDSRFYVWENNRLKLIYKTSATRPSIVR